MAAIETFLLTSQFAAAAAFLLLAALLLAVRFNSRVNRAFAIFLLLRGATLLLLAFARAQAGEPVARALESTSFYFSMAAPFALLYFVAIYRSPTGGLFVRAMGVSAVLFVVVAEVIYATDHCMANCSTWPNVAGPLTPILQGLPLAQGLAGLALATRHWSTRTEPRAHASAIVASALALLGLLEGAQVLGIFAAEGAAGFWSPFEPNAWIVISRVFGLAAVLASLTALVILHQSMGTVRRRRLLLVATAAVLATAATLAIAHSREQVASTPTFLFGFWRLVGAGLVAYALVRHRFLDLDLRINWTISRGTVVAVLLATFIVVSQVIENMLDATLGLVFGGVATGAMLLAIRPLERLGDRVASGVLPRGRVDQLEQRQRLEIFREQATMVWSDGVIGRKERVLLDALRQRLGIDAAAAVDIEHEAALQANVHPKALELSTHS